MGDVTAPGCVTGSSAGSCDCVGCTGVVGAAGVDIVWGILLVGAVVTTWPPLATLTVKLSSFPYSLLPQLHLSHVGEAVLLKLRWNPHLCWYYFLPFCPLVPFAVPPAVYACIWHARPCEKNLLRIFSKKLILIYVSKNINLVKCLVCCVEYLIY